jgi:hypothetical protein
MNGDESTVYIVADTLVKLMQTPIYDMCALPELPDLSELNLRAITIQGPVPAAEPAEDGEEEGGEADAPAEEPVVLRIGHSQGETGDWHLALLEFKKDLEARTNGFRRGLPERDPWQ